MLANPQLGASKANKGQFLLLAGGRSTATRLRSARPLGAGSAEHGCCKRGLPRALQLRPHLAQPPLEQIFICACEGGAPRAPRALETPGFGRKGRRLCLRCLRGQSASRAGPA